MKQTPASGVSLRTLILISIISITVFSCATYNSPEALRHEISGIHGKYTGDFESNGEMYKSELILFPDGYFVDFIYSYSSDSTNVDVGTYVYDPGTKEIAFSYFEDKPENNFSVKVSDDFSSFAENDEIYTKSPDFIFDDTDFTFQTVADEYILEYTYENERVIVSLLLNDDGSFIEQSIYPESEEIWTENGTYSLTPASGVISFDYPDWEEGNFTGYLDFIAGVLYSDEGEFIAGARELPLRDIPGKAPSTQDLQFPHLANSNKIEFDLNSLVSGVVHNISTDELGLLKLTVETRTDYYLDGKEKEESYRFIYGGMKEISVKKGDSIAVGDYLGTASAHSYITSYSDSLNRYLLRMTGSYPVKYNEKWYYSPDWVIPGHTAWLSFRQVPRFDDAVLDFYTRWADEGNPANGSTIHYFPDLDRIRARIQLESYPVEASKDSAIRLVENMYYNGANVFVLQTVLDKPAIDNHKIVIYWQKNFDTYLKEEYSLGEDLFIYASIYAIDHDEREILVCVRDFALQSDEDIIAERLENFKLP